MNKYSIIPTSEVLSPLLRSPPKESILSSDVFFREFYRFYCNKGIFTTLLGEISSVFTLGFVIAFSVYLFEFVDWNAVIHCSDEETCRALNDHFATNPFHHTPKFTSFLSALYFLLFLGVWVWRASVAVHSVRNAFDMSAFYREKLNISDADLETLDWPKVLEKLIFAHKAGVVQVLPKPDVTVNDVVLRIMRSENYMIALINRNCLHMFLPWWLAPFFTESILFTKSMEWSISYCVLLHLFDDEFRLAPEFLNDIQLLKFRFQLVGLLQLFLLPFTFIFVIVYFLMENFQQFHSNRAYLGPRQWTPLARWEFREFNELPHLFEQRLNRAYEPSLSYLNSFSNLSVAIVAEFVAFVSGACVAVLIITSFISEGALLYIHIAERNLLWYLGIFSACFAASRACIPDATKIKPSVTELLHNACAMTHHFPPHWKDQEQSKLVRDEVSYLLQHKIVIFLFEMLGVLLTPVILVFSLPLSAGTIVDFVQKHTRIVDGIGAVCDYSLLEVEKYGDNQFGSEPSDPYAIPAERLNFGKLEKSVLNFKQTYSSLVPNKSLHRFQDNLSCYKEIKREQRANLLSSIMELPGRQSSLGSNVSVSSEVLNDGDSNNSPRRPLVGGQGSPRSNMVTSTFVHRAHGSSGRVNECKGNLSPQSDLEMHALHSPEIKTSASLPFPRLETSSKPSYSYSTSRQQDLFTSTIPSLLHQTGFQNQQSMIMDLPDVLLSVLREQNIDYRNDFYWLNRFHAEQRQNPVELSRSLMQFRQQQQQQQHYATHHSNGARGGVDRHSGMLHSPILMREKSDELPMDSTLMQLPASSSSSSSSVNALNQLAHSPDYPGFHLSGVQAAETNIFMPPSGWSPPSSATKSSDA